MLRDRAAEREAEPQGQSEVDRSVALFERRHRGQCERTDRSFAVLLLIEWIAGIAAAVIFTPWSWHGTMSEVHPHVVLATLGGLAIISVPLWLTEAAPGSASTRYAIGAAQALYSGVLIHVSGGRIETHFHVFVSLAFLSFYRDPKVLAINSALVILDHLMRGLYWPRSIYGTTQAEQWRWLEHSAWILFEDVVLAVSIARSLADSQSSAERQAHLSTLKESFESEVVKRTSELQASEQKFRRIADRTPAFIWSTRPRPTLHLCEPDLAGLSREAGARGARPVGHRGLSSRRSRADQ